MMTPCPNKGCNERIQRCEISKHCQICQYEVSCMFANIGCKKKINRKVLQVHEQNSQQHFQLAIDTLKQLATGHNQRTRRKYSTAAVTGNGAYFLCC